MFLQIPPIPVSPLWHHQNLTYCNVKPHTRSRQKPWPLRTGGQQSSINSIYSSQPLYDAPFKFRVADRISTNQSVSPRSQNLLIICRKRTLPTNYWVAAVFFYSCVWRPFSSVCFPIFPIFLHITMHHTIGKKWVKYNGWKGNKI